jgi:hypothetical protein
VTLTVAHPGLRAERLFVRLGELIRARPEILTAVLCGIILAIGQRGPDLPAQAYRVFLVRHHGLVAYDTHWYAGHPLPGYSLLFPPLAAFLGARFVGALACIAGTALFARLLRGRARTGDDIAIVWFAVVSVVDLIVGRLPFALGLTLGIAALVAVRERRTWWAWVFAILCSCASPLAGAFLLLAAAAWWPDIGRRVVPCAGTLVGIVAAAVFGEGGWFPFPWTALFIIELLCIGGLVIVPRSQHLLRRGLAAYGIASAVLFPWSNPIGGNMIRLGAMVGGPIIAIGLLRADRPWLRIDRRWVLGVVSIPLLIWGFAPLPNAFAVGRDNPSAHSSYYTGLLRYLDAHDGAAGRLEVPLTEGRWESDYLAAKVSLARGWERQVDRGRNDVLYDDELSAASYRRWLLANGVRWVALPDVPLDDSETGEGKLLGDHTPSFLRLVWQDKHWKLWAVRDARPIVTGAARLVKLDVSSVDLQATGIGTAIVLVRWTRFWRVTEGEACVAPTPDGWTQVEIQQPGPIRISATVGLGSLTGAGGKGSCSGGD